jgi:hypothetical protein
MPISRTTKRRAKLYWGYFVIAAVVLAELTGGTPHELLVAAAGLGLLYVLFWVPTSCLATTKELSSCKHNSRGLLGGCSQVRAHGVANRTMVLRARWREIVARFAGTYRNKAATSGLVVSLGSVVYALVVTLI